jgi:hypothetical protein
MKRMVKSRVFLMSMAVMAGLPAGAHAQAGSKGDLGYQYSSGGRGAPSSVPNDVIQEAPEMRLNGESGGITSSLFGKLKGMAESVSSNVEAVSAVDQAKAWKLGVSQDEVAKLGATEDPRLSASKPVGEALRLKF